MPIHDWTKVQSGLFHHFHRGWTVRLAAALNTRLQVVGHYALLERRSEPLEPLAYPSDVELGVLDQPKTRFSAKAKHDAIRYAEKADRISIRHNLGRVVAVIEIVSPGNKHSSSAVKDFVDKVDALLLAGVHVVVLDLFPPTRRDPAGLHALIVERYGGDPYEPPADKPLTLSSFAVVPRDETTTYIEPAAVGDVLFPMPLFLTAGFYVDLPLEETYMATWAACPEPIRMLVSA